MRRDRIFILMCTCNHGNDKSRAVLSMFQGVLFVPRYAALFCQLVSVSNLDEISFIRTFMKLLPDLHVGVTNTREHFKRSVSDELQLARCGTFVRFIDCSQCVFVRLCCIANGVL